MGLLELFRREKRKEGVTEDEEGKECRSPNCHLFNAYCTAGIKCS